MDLKEAFRVLELEIGASRADVDASYLRLLEKWHPGRVAAQGPAAVREAQAKVQAVNDAYNLLAAVAPTTTQPPIPLPASSSAPKATPAPPSAPEAPRVPAAKPKLAPLSTAQPDLNRPPPPKPPPGAWESRTSPAPGATPAPPAPALASSPSPGPKPASSPPPVANNPAPPPPAAPFAPPPGAAAPPPAPPPEPAASAPEPLAAPPASFSDRLIKLAEYYNTLFPLDTPRRRFGPYVVAGALVLVLLLGKCAFSSSGHRRAREPDPKTTGRLVVKSNLASATVEAARIPTPDDATTARFSGTIDHALAGLPPGKYAVTARLEGWPDSQEEVNVEAGRATEVAVNFKSGSLHLDSDPTGAEVRMGAAALGRTPLDVPQLPPGECQLFLDYASWPAVSFKTTIAEGVTTTVTVRLPHGKLTVETTPPGAKVLLGGQVLGQTPLTLERFPAGTRRLGLQARDFPALEFSVTVEDGGDVKVHPALGSVFPLLDPVAILRDVWVPDSADNIAPPLEGLSGPSKPQNGIIRNLNRKRLYDYWLRKRYSFTGIVKLYDRPSGQVELVEQQSEFSKYRVVAKLSNGSRNDQDLAAQLTKGATFAFYGRLTAVEEPRWPFKVITFELSSAEPLR